MKRRPLNARRRWIVLGLAAYFVAGTASQKLLPGIDEVFPLFGWSLFSKVPNTGNRYTVVISRQDGSAVEPPVLFLEAPESIVRGNRYIASKLIERIGRAEDEGDRPRANHLRGVFEANYLRGEVRYELIHETYDLLEKWTDGTNLERRSLGIFGQPAAAAGESVP